MDGAAPWPAWRGAAPDPAARYATAGLASLGPVFDYDALASARGSTG